MTEIAFCNYREDGKFWVGFDGGEPYDTHVTLGLKNVETSLRYMVENLEEYK